LASGRWLIPDLAFCDGIFQIGKLYNPAWRKIKSKRKGTSWLQEDGLFRIWPFAMAFFRLEKLYRSSLAKDKK
jgi:hypothetical protein